MTAAADGRGAARRARCRARPSRSRWPRALGLVAFCWPFVVAPGRVRQRATTAPLMFGVLLVLVLAVVFAEIADGGIDAKALAMLGVLSAINAGAAPARRRHRRASSGVLPAGPGRAGVRAGLRVRARLHVAVRLGAAHRRGRARGCRTRCSAAPGWGSVAGLLPRGCAAGREIVMLAGYGAVAGYAVRVPAQPVVLAVLPSTRTARSPTCRAPSFGEQWHRYLLFDAATSLGWDTGRAVTTLVGILLVGPAALATFRRAARRASFAAPVSPRESGRVGSTRRN